MIKHLYLMRHATTIFNEQGILQGWCDSPLSAYGQAQTKKMAALLCKKKLHFDHVYASTLGRAQQTARLMVEGMARSDAATKAAEACCKACGEASHPVILGLDALREVRFGSLEKKPTSQAPKAPFGDALVAFGGEREQDAQQRICSCLTQIMQREDHHTVLAISHGAISMLFYEAAQHAEAANVSRDEWPSNASIIHYEYNGAVFCATEILEENFDDISKTLIRR